MIRNVGFNRLLPMQIVVGHDTLQFVLNCFNILVCYSQIIGLIVENFMEIENLITFLYTICISTI